MGPIPYLAIFPARATVHRAGMAEHHGGLMPNFEFTLLIQFKTYSDVSFSFKIWSPKISPSQSRISHIIPDWMSPLQSVLHSVSF